jgi:hypothetical protein
VTDDTAAIQEALDSINSGGALFIPSGTYKITSKLVLTIGSTFSQTSVHIYGEGSASVISASTITGIAFEILPNNSWNVAVSIIEDFSIKSPTIVSGTVGLQSSDTNGTTGLSLSRISVSGFDVGFKFVGNQFCSYKELMGTSCNVGVYHTQSIIGGGGNNITYYDCKFSYNVVGVFIDAPSIYPLHDVQFVNLTTHVNSVCPFYLNDARLISISNWAPEANGAGAASYSFAGQTVVNSILHIENNSNITLKQYQHTSTTQYIYAYTSSIVCIDGGSGGSTLWITDSTSFITFTSNPYYMYGGSGNSVILNAPNFIVGGVQTSLITTPALSPAKWLLNDAVAVYGSDVDIGSWSGGTFSAATYVTDATLGYVSQFTYAGSGSGSQTVISTSSSSYTGIDTVIVFSALIKSSSSSASWTFSFAQGTVFANVKLPANEWVRIVLVGGITTTPRNANLVITPDASAIGSTLKVCKIHTMTNPNSKDLAAFVAKGLYNNGQRTDEYRLSAAPTLGTWEVGGIVYNKSPVAGGTTGWICTTAGTPGTWKTFGAIAP